MSSTLEWVKILVGGSIGGFIGSIFLDPLIKKIQSPPIEVLFPINKRTDIQSRDTSPYIVFQNVSLNNDFIVVRCFVSNQSRVYTVEQCRVFLKKIETRNSPDQDWASTEYEESNQVKWSGEQSRFEAQDIFPWTKKAFEPLRLCCGYPRYEIFVNAGDHYSFRYIFRNPLPNEKGWKFSFLVTGKNILPTKFNLILESFWVKSHIGRTLVFHVNNCPLNRTQLALRN